MPDYWPGYLEYSDHVQDQLIAAEWRRMQRTQAETAARDQKLARQLIKFVLTRLMSERRAAPTGGYLGAMTARFAAANLQQEMDASR